MAQGQSYYDDPTMGPLLDPTSAPNLRSQVSTSDIPTQAGANPVDTGIVGPTGGVPSYVNLSDPTQAAVWAAYQKKGITPRDQGDFQYWIDNINRTGGWGNASNQAYWLDRMGQAQGGVGDYAGRPEAGGAMMDASTFGSLLQPFSGSLNLPTFSYPDFTAPTGDEALKADPGYLFRVGQGEQALQQSAAARGVLNTGGSLKDILSYGQNAASQEYGSFYDRRLNEYLTNRNNAFGNATFNQGALTTNYDRQYQAFRNRALDTNAFLTDQQKIGAGTI